MPVIGQATTPTITYLAPEDLDMTTTRNIYFTLSQGERKITKTGSDLFVTASSVGVYLSQRDTVWLDPDREAKHQLNWTFSDGRRGMTREKIIEIDPNLLPEVLA